MPKGYYPHRKGPYTPIVDRFWSKVEKTESCWNWMGGIKNNGYGEFFTQRVNGKVKMVHAHRFSYEVVKGKIPDGLVIDHLCRNSKCVNPDHLEPVTQKENIIRGNLCSKIRCKVY